MAIEAVFAVDELIARLVEGPPVCLTILALGRSSSTGWTNASLSRRVRIAPPGDGVEEIDFVAERPASLSSAVMTPISASTELQDVDVANHWGPGLPLKGIRVHAAANVKTSELLGRDETVDLIAQMSPRALASYVSASRPGVPGYEEDIRPLFRDRDARVMLAIAGFDLHSFQEVKDNATRILGRLTLNMPCDGLWPDEDIAKFKAWIDGGMPA